MAKKRTTHEERKEFIEEMRKRDPRTLPRDMTFIDRRGNIVHPNKRDYEVTRAKQRDYQQEDAIKINKQYDNLIKKYGRNSEEVYEFEREYGMRKSKRRGMEGTLAIVVLVAGIFFLSINITGNVIGNLSQNSTNVVGIALLTIGLIAGYLWVKKK